MTALRDRLVRLIEASGPISVADYFSACLFDPDHGYYTARDPFGADGDFTTAPEVSQMFGELVAVWLVSAWDAAGQPSGALVAEIGPGRGTLMCDILRTLRSLSPELPRMFRFAMIEASPRLAGIQKTALDDFDVDIAWHATVATLPEAPLFIVGNELFDALPLRQYVRVAGGWRERMVGLAGDATLTFTAGPTLISSAAILPVALEKLPEGTIVETAPARTALMAEISAHIATRGGAGLFFDYGTGTWGPGDTLQSVYRHAHVNVFAHPGEADLTSHVDFGALAAAARSQGLKDRLASQGDFLRAMGLRERSERLAQGKDKQTAARIAGEAERLAGKAGMGTLFKALAVTPPDLAVPGFD